jgi:hypothetical protein
MTQRSNVLPKRVGPDEARFGTLFVAGLARVAAKIGKGTLADRMGRTVRSLENIMAGGSTSGKAMCDALLADHTALDEVLADYGFKLVPLTLDAANDLNTAAGLLDGATELVRSQHDGHRDHSETLRVADKLRPHLPAALAIVREADQIRGVA